MFFCGFCKRWKKKSEMRLIKVRKFKIKNGNKINHPLPLLKKICGECSERKKNKSKRRSNHGRR